ncbi:SIL1 [Magnaporthiopsis poae ATCC 64411]|uniref:Nucleotide exchange factor SIL1 n=1 Tax=Magnaporthiopsis poae (strain ATCC 64411 / 73-15) TaxID=644358 RepID=A0A0C4DLG7_MAGP6|nr:SIL1 [Magnaporthiopsis poae ATCC 64411]
MVRRILTVLAVSLAARASSGAAQEPATGDGDIICHPENAVDCYHKIFQATHEFKPVRPGQDIPSGLHVRLNIYTGEKEAKINVPSEHDPALAGLSVENAVITVDSEPQEPAGEHIRPDAPAYEAVGKIKEAVGPEALQFSNSLALLGKRKGVDAAGLDGALDKLEELSHDLYYGLKISQDLPALSSLFCLMNDGHLASSKAVAASEAPRAILAARTISAAVQNNPPALKAVEVHWPALLKTKCTRDGSGHSPLGRLVFSIIQPDQEPRAAGRESSLARAKLSAIKGLIKSARIRQDFLEKGGMREVLRVLLVKDSLFAEAQVKAANLVTDTFLDENMGATLGLWPAKAPAHVATCDRESPDLSDGCWRLWIEGIAEDNKFDSTHWSVELLQMLKSRLGPGSEAQGRRTENDEL